MLTDDETQYAWCIPTHGLASELDTISPVFASLADAMRWAYERAENRADAWKKIAGGCNHPLCAVREEWADDWNESATHRVLCGVKGGWRAVTATVDPTYWDVARDVDDEFSDDDFPA